MFQLTTSRRGRHVDSFAAIYYREVSTHDLTKRSTAYNLLCAYLSSVSTHDLTKRSTLESQRVPLSPMFQLTTSRRGRRSGTHSAMAYHVFQLTTSRRGRRFHRFFAAHPSNVSTHDLTKRSTSLLSNSRGFTPSFNSRPHEEVDRVPLPI